MSEIMTPYLINQHQTCNYNPVIKLSGAAEARRAHNPEGNGSKPFSATKESNKKSSLSSNLLLFAAHSDQMPTWRGLRKPNEALFYLSSKVPPNFPVCGGQ